jgi:small subunit ribosomal protein S21
MLIITNKDCDTVDKLLRKYKKKFDKAQTIKQLRSRKAFIKPSIVRRQEVLKAVYVRKTYRNLND